MVGYDNIIVSYNIVVVSYDNSCVINGIRAYKTKGKVYTLGVKS